MDTNYYKKYEPFFNAWHIKSKIGEGSFGKVYEIERTEFGKTYTSALKIITIPQNQDEVKSVIAEGMDEQSTYSYFKNMVEELLDEFYIMSKVKGNSNIVSYEDHAVFEHTDGIGWDILIRMERLTPLLEYVQKKPFAEKDVIKMGCDICTALEICRNHNIIHRDIKPENIFVSNDGNFKLGDFGIARTIEKTTTLSTKGTYTYMAPEVYNGQPYSASADIYSLGIVLYRFLNQNRTPFIPDYPATFTFAEKSNALIRRIAGEDIPPIKNTNKELSDVVLKACSYKRDNRYALPEDFKRELSKAAGVCSQQEQTPKITTTDYVGIDNQFEDDKTELMFNDFTNSDTLIINRNVPKKKDRRFLYAIVLVALLLVGTVIYFICANNNYSVSTETIFQYDKNGNVISEVNYDEDGLIDFRDVYEYDENGKKLKSTSYNADGTLKTYRLREYDEKGNMIRYTRYHADGTVDFYDEYEYDENGKERAYKRVLASGEVESATTYLYDESGNRIQSVYYDGNNQIKYYRIREYNSNNIIIKYSEYDEKDILKSYCVYGYDEKGLLIKETIYNADDTLDHYTTYEYDSSGNLNRTNFYNADASLESYVISEFDQQGNLTKETLYK